MNAILPLAHLAPYVVLAFAVLVFPILFFVAAPYGRHLRHGFGPLMPARLGWVVMESPSLFLFGALFAMNGAHASVVGGVAGCLWLVHYAQRTLLFPALMRGERPRKPVLTVALAVVFNILNATGNAVALRERDVDVAFVAGVAVFVVGFAINLHADHVLRNLRAPGESGYKIPYGGLYRLVSAPNYLGEILEWVGFALAAQTLAGWAFAAFTIANLAPRAWSHHRWYREKFPDYPRGRRALVPLLW